MSSSSTSIPDSLAIIKAFLATSIPLKSSLGSGSVKPKFLAPITASLNKTPSSSFPKIYESEPDIIPEKAFNLSPDLKRF